MPLGSEVSRLLQCFKRPQAIGHINFSREGRNCVLAEVEGATPENTGQTPCPANTEPLHPGADPAAGCSWSRASPAAEPGPWPGWAQRRCPIIPTLYRGVRKSPAGTDPTLPVSALLGPRVAQLILAAGNCSGIPPGWDETHMQLGVPWPVERHPLTAVFI